MTALGDSVVEPPDQDQVQDLLPIFALQPLKS
jgi:hypothetical protein